MTGEQWEQVKEVFEELAEASPEGQSERLASLPDREIAAEVKRLLANLTEASPEFLAEPAQDFHTASPAEREPKFRPGEVLGGRFHIVRLIGSGGMGEVYEAEDRQLGTKIAVKSLAAQWNADYDIERRFRREVHVARQITHSNVCRVYDIFTHHTPDGEALLITMELLDGETLAARLRRLRRMTVEEVWPLLRQLVAGLEAAHQCGIIHRDLKPANLMICSGSGASDERLAITDFGLARPERRGDASRSSNSLLLGTPAYMAPEQFLGDAGIRSDIYSLGVILYEMLVGVTPPRDASKLFPDGYTVPRRWQRAIQTCLAADPARRFQSASEMLAGIHPER
ncbi:MAG: serine/threonine-protein kinase, partial [Bryobacteraceae bacterium]